jgi:hypothetical protein
MRCTWLVLALALPGCFKLVVPPGGYEDDEIACADGRDNDQDRRIDCMDGDCIMRGFCGEQLPLIPINEPEDNFDACRDGMDNDGDGQFDCGDRGCQLIMELCCNAEFDDRSCSDGFDNEGNGFADCADFSCRNNRFVSVCASETACFDAADIEMNGTTCSTAQAEATGNAHCSDGIDNDGDRLVDRGDPDCEGWPREASCSNGIDDNGDGKTDCSDVGCATSPACMGPENTLVYCSDGISNDGDTFVDCDDFDCSNSPDPDIIAYCATPMGETTLEQCTNGIDDDNNRYQDCADFSCQNEARGATPEAAAYCAEHAETTMERCSDGIDNDGNTYVDCGDFSCSRNVDPMIVTYCMERSDSTIATCSDGIDNDGNGYTDCEDFSCNFALISWGVQACLTTADCPLGQSCYRSSCLGILAPCFETAWIEAKTSIQGNQAGRIPTDSTPAEQAAMSVALCSDGIDNDGDGFTDCEDWECNYSPHVVDASGTPLCRSSGGNTCIFGPSIGVACGSDINCGGVSGACHPGGAAGSAFVCP